VELPSVLGTIVCENGRVVIDFGTDLERGGTFARATLSATDSLVFFLHLDRVKQPCRHDSS
jgi:hypothetical protein